jgi:hypothetical protein
MADNLIEKGVRSERAIIFRRAMESENSIKYLSRDKVLQLLSDVIWLCQFDIKSNNYPRYQMERIINICLMVLVDDLWEEDTV